MKKSEIIRQLEDTIRSTKRRIEDMIQDGETDRLDQEREIWSTVSMGGNQWDVIVMWTQL